MKIVGCLSWFAEAPAWLSAACASAAKLCDHVVAVDGAYALFPGGLARSAAVEHEAVRETVEAAGMGLTLHVPRTVWQGNEVEKRALMLALALEIADNSDEDWVYVFDSDTVTWNVPDDLREQLAATEFAVAGVSLFERYHPIQEWPISTELELTDLSVNMNHRMLYRALEGLTVAGTHYGYRADGRVFWGPGQEECLCLPDFRVEHRSRHRDLDRQRRARAYYASRDALGVERFANTMVKNGDGEFVKLP